MSNGVKKQPAIFQKDSKFNRFMGWLGTLILTNIYFIICSLPVITMGASFVALNTVCLKMREGEDVKVTPVFFKAFASEFLKATPIWIISLGIISGGGFAAYNIIKSGSSAGHVIGAGACGMVALIVLGAFVYYFMLLARYENDIFGHIKNAFKISAVNLGNTLLIIAIWVACIAPFALVNVILWYAGWIWLMVGVAMVVYFTSAIYLKIFKKIETREEDD